MNPMYLPLFVYGTLLPGQANYGAIQKWVIDTAPAYLPAARLWVGYSYPILEQYRSGLGVRGTLLAIDRRMHKEVLDEVDEIEGYLGEGRSDNLYLRTSAMVHVDAGPGSTWFGQQIVRAWVYVGSPETLEGIEAEATLSRTGDFLKDMHIPA